MSEILNIAAAAILDQAGNMLLVRKVNTTTFMQPGGKIDEGESPKKALCRELKEELALEIEESELEDFGSFEAVAANEKDTKVKADVFRFKHSGPFVPMAEIEEILWYPSEFKKHMKLAPLTEQHIIPASGVNV